MTTPEPTQRTWQDEIMKLAALYYENGHADENRAREIEVHISTANDAGTEGRIVELLTRADVYQGVYGDLCALIARVDPRPGGPGGPGRPW